jgi:hypothetical protein
LYILFYSLIRFSVAREWRELNDLCVFFPQHKPSAEDPARNERLKNQRRICLLQRKLHQMCLLPTQMHTLAWELCMFYLTKNVFNCTYPQLHKL